MTQQSVRIVVNNTEYTIRAELDSAVLHRAVEEVNERIKKYKNRTNKDELRAAVMAALSFATEQDELRERIRELEEEQLLLLEEASRISDKLGDKLQDLK